MGDKILEDHRKNMIEAKARLDASGRSYDRLCDFVCTLLEESGKLIDAYQSEKTRSFVLQRMVMRTEWPTVTE